MENRIILIQPAPEHREQAMDYKIEFMTEHESMDGSAGLLNAVSYEDWLRALADNSRPETVRPGLVPSSTFLGVRKQDGRLIGMIDIRHTLNDFLLQEGGHIGYSVRQSERRQGYASEMLALALEKCREMGITKALITCNRDNIASAHTILRAGGILENEVSTEHGPLQRYWVEV